MTAVTLVVVALTMTRLSMARAAVLGTGVGLLSRVPGLIVPLGAAALLVGVRGRVRARTEAAALTRRRLADLAEMTAVGLTAGLGVQPALGLAATAQGGPLSEEVGRVLRTMRVDGVGTLLTAAGAVAPLYRTLGRSVVTGAPALGAVILLAEQLHGELAAEQAQAVRRLPIAMLFPLTLLILPGFVLLTVAPALLDAFGRLQL